MSSKADTASELISLCVPELRGREWAYLKECVDTGFVSSVGSFVPRFEREIAKYVGIDHAVATTSGTAALHVALCVAGVERDDEVLVSTLSFIAPANAIRYVGAWPVFIDAEPQYWQMDPSRVAAFLDGQCHMVSGELRNKTTGRRVRAILPVHILGHPVDLDPILEMARNFGLAVIEDATESLGARYRGRSVGALADLSALSFNGNKLITSGGGGMLLTADRTHAERAAYLTTQAKDDAIEFVHGAVGFNYRLTNIQAAVGLAQAECLDSFLAAKRRHAIAYSEALRHVPGIEPPVEAPWATSAWWLYSVRLDEAQYGCNRRVLQQRLIDAGILVRPLWQPLHLSPAHKGAVVPPCPVAEALYESVLSLPSSVGLTESDRDRVIDTIAASAARH